MAYVYADQNYDTQAEVEAAVTAFKARLDNNPTDWVKVKLLSGNAEDGWVVPTETLSDAEINSLDANSFYSVSDIHGGANETGLSGTEATAKVAEFRTTYARWKRANTITEIYVPTNEDMSGYV